MVPRNSKNTKITSEIGPLFSVSSRGGLAGKPPQDCIVPVLGTFGQIKLSHFGGHLGRKYFIVLETFGSKIPEIGVGYLFLYIVEQF